MKFFKPVNLGKKGLCLVLSIILFKANIIVGSIVITQITPNNTPFAITKPISFPNVRFMLHNAKKPAIVVRELPTIDTKVFPIAVAIASFISFVFSRSSI